ncbi:hypothetical protein S83_065119, partial [Arachis hypogaea]
MEIDELLLLYRPCNCSASEGEPSSSVAKASISFCFVTWILEILLSLDTFFGWLDSGSE